jgi:hypothetical protein
MVLFSISQSRVITEVFAWERVSAVTVLASLVACSRFAYWAALPVREFQRDSRCYAAEGASHQQRRSHWADLHSLGDWHLH